MDRSGSRIVKGCGIVLTTCRLSTAPRCCAWSVCCTDHVDDPTPSSKWSEDNESESTCRPRLCGFELFHGFGNPGCQQGAVRRRCIQSRKGFGQTGRARDRRNLVRALPENETNRLRACRKAGLQGCDDLRSRFRREQGRTSKDQSTSCHHAHRLSRQE